MTTPYGTQPQQHRPPNQQPQRPYPPQYPPQQQYPRQYAQPEPQQARPHPLALVGVTLWRLAIISAAMYGFLDATDGGTKNLRALSQQASLVTAIIYAGLLLYPLFVLGKRHEPKSPWWRGANAVLLLLVAGTYFGIMGGSFDYYPFEHFWTPLLVLVDVLFVGRNQANVKWWHPLTWLSLPLTYFVYYLTNEIYNYLYPFLSPDGEMFAAVVGVLLGGTVAVGYLLYGANKLKGSLGRQTVAPQQPNAHTAPGWTR